MLHGTVCSFIHRAAFICICNIIRCIDSFQETGPGLREILNEEKEKHDRFYEAFIRPDQLLA